MDMPRDSPLFQKNACALNSFWTPVYHRELSGLAVFLIKQAMPPKGPLNYDPPVLHGGAFISTFQ